MKTPDTPTPEPKPEGWMTDVRGIAAMLKCSARHVHRLRDIGRLPARVRLGNLVRWDRHVIEEWIAAGCPAVRKN